MSGIVVTWWLNLLLLRWLACSSTTTNRWMSLELAPFISSKTDSLVSASAGTFCVPRLMAASRWQQRCAETFSRTITIAWYNKATGTLYILLEYWTVVTSPPSSNKRWNRTTIAITQTAIEWSGSTINGNPSTQKELPGSSNSASWSQTGQWFALIHCVNRLFFDYFPPVFLDENNTDKLGDFGLLKSTCTGEFREHIW